MLRALDALTGPGWKHRDDSCFRPGLQLSDLTWPHGQGRVELKPDRSTVNPPPLRATGGHGSWVQVPCWLFNLRPAVPLLAAAWPLGAALVFLAFLPGKKQTLRSESPQHRSGRYSFAARLGVWASWAGVGMGALCLVFTWP